MANAQQVSRAFDFQLGACIVVVRDEFGHDSYHTILLSSDAVDVDAQVAQILADTDARTAALRERMLKAGWQSQPG